MVTTVAFALVLLVSSTAGKEHSLQVCDEFECQMEGRQALLQVGRRSTISSLTQVQTCQSGIGQTATLDEQGYISVRHEDCSEEMLIFVRRLIEGGKVACDYSQEACRRYAQAQGLQLGGAGAAFAGDYATKGCYTYASGRFAGRAYYGTVNGGDITEDQLGALSSGQQTRVSTCAGPVCVEGGLAGLIPFYDCDDDHVSYADLLAALAAAADPNGNCSWIGAPECPPFNTTICGSFPGATLPPCIHKDSTTPATTATTTAATATTTVATATSAATTAATTTTAAATTVAATTTTTTTSTIATTIATTTTAPPGGECKWPANAKVYSLITKDFAKIGAHDVYSPVVVGGELSDGSPNENTAIASHRAGKSFANSIKAGGRWDFKGGRETGFQLTGMFRWSDFEWLAMNLKNHNSGGYKIKVFNRGGQYSTYDIQPGGQGEDNGKSLMVFTTSETIILTKTNDGRQFGPSVLAPFAKVVLANGAGFIDGCLIAKQFGSSDGSLQMHGDCYKGPLKCK